MEKRLYILLLILSFISCKGNKKVQNNPVNSNTQTENITQQQQIPDSNKLNNTEPIINQNSSQNIINMENKNNLDNTTKKAEQQINNTNENLNKNEKSIEDNKETKENKNNNNQPNEKKNNELKEGKKDIKNQKNEQNQNEEKVQNINKNINESNQKNKEEPNKNNIINQNIKLEQNNKQKIEQENINSENIEKNNKNKFQPLKERIKINIRKYLLDCHKELKKYIPYPYDYLISFFVGYLFISLFIFSKSSINITNNRKFSDQNVLLINNKIKEISQLQDKFKNKVNNKPNIQNNNLKKINLNKFDELQNKLNELFQFVNIRNSDTSNENILRENICTLQMEIMTKIDNMIKK